MKFFTTLAFSLIFPLALLISSALAFPVGTITTPFPLLLATCPTTLAVFPHFNAGPTSTFFPSTITATSSVDCGGCDDLVTSTLFLGVGPVVHFTKTVTAKTPSTAVAFVCSSTAGPY